MQSAIEKYIPYNDNLYEKTIAFILYGVDDSSIELFIKTLIYYGTMYVKFNKLREVCGVIWECKKCSTKYCIGNVPDKDHYNILSHIEITKLCKSYNDMMGFGIMHKDDIRPKFTATVEKYNDTVVRINADNRISDNDKKILLYQLQLYDLEEYICDICGSVVVADSFDDHVELEHHLKHLIDNINAMSLGCPGKISDDVSTKK